jgi:hypothetical protein
VWHCHILEHEEHDMMRPLVVLSKLSVVPPNWVIPSFFGGKMTFTVNNAVSPITVTPSIAPSPTTYQLSVDQVKQKFTVTVPKNASGIPKPGMTVKFTVTDASMRQSANKMDTATVLITHLI